MNAAGGASGGTYSVLTGTNLALPLAGWTVLTNGVFDAGGQASVADSVGDGSRFYILRVP